MEKSAVAVLVALTAEWSDLSREKRWAGKMEVKTVGQKVATTDFYSAAWRVDQRVNEMVDNSVSLMVVCWAQ